MLTGGKSVSFEINRPTASRKFPSSTCRMCVLVGHFVQLVRGYSRGQLAMNQPRYLVWYRDLVLHRNRLPMWLDRNKVTREGGQAAAKNQRDMEDRDVW